MQKNIEQMPALLEDVAGVNFRLSLSRPQAVWVSHGHGKLSELPMGVVIDDLKLSMSSHVVGVTHGVVRGFYSRPQAVVVNHARGHAVHDFDLGIKKLVGRENSQWCNGRFGLSHLLRTNLFVLDVNTILIWTNFSWNLGFLVPMLDVQDWWIQNGVFDYGVSPWSTWK